MDIQKKKQEVLEDIARQPANVVFARISICDTIQLSELLKEQFVPFLRGPANSSSGTNATDSLHEVCVNLAHQRALLQGAAAATNPATGILAFNINDGTAATRADGTAAHNTTSDLSFPKLVDVTYSSKTSFPFVVLHDLLRFLQISPDLALVISSLKISIIGIVLVLILRFRSEGLIPERPIIINRDKRA